MRWEHEAWRKLYCRVDAGWLALPVSARGLGDELLKYADDAGRIEIGSDSPGLAVAYLLSARPKEHKRIAEDVAELMKGSRPYLVMVGPTMIGIRNFEPAQSRSSSAKRMAEKRARDRTQPVTVTPPVTPASDAAVPVTVTEQSDGSETRRDETRRVGDANVTPPTPRQAWAHGLGHALGMAVQVQHWPEEHEALDSLAGEAEAKGVPMVELVARDCIRWTRDPKAKLRAKGRGWRPSDFLDWRSREALDVEPEAGDARRPPVFTPEPRGEHIQPPDIAAALRDGARPATRPSARVTT